MIFISCSFDPIALPNGEFVQSLFEEYDIQAYIAEHPEAEPLPTFLKSKIIESEALVALITEQESPWQQTEITWACKAAWAGWFSVRGYLAGEQKLGDFEI